MISAPVHNNNNTQTETAIVRHVSKVIGYKGHKKPIVDVYDNHSKYNITYNDEIQYYYNAKTKRIGYVNVETGKKHGLDRLLSSFKKGDNYTKAVDKVQRLAGLGSGYGTYIVGLSHNKRNQYSVELRANNGDHYTLQNRFLVTKTHVYQYGYFTGTKYLIN